MNNFFVSLKWFFIAIGTVLTDLLGGWDVALKVLIGFVLLDYFTGVTAAYALKVLDSQIGFRGIARKILLFVPVAIGYWLDVLLGQDIFRSLAVFFYIANEGLSIIENLGKLGLPIPDALTQALQQLRSKNPEEPKAQEGQVK